MYAFTTPKKRHREDRISEQTKTTWSRWTSSVIVLYRRKRKFHRAPKPDRARSDGQSDLERAVADIRRDVVVFEFNYLSAKPILLSRAARMKIGNEDADAIS